MRTLCKFLFLVLTATCLSGCFVEGNVKTISNEDNANLLQPPQRTIPDFLPGEVVTSSSGYRIRAVVGEIPVEQALPNGYKVRGVFYQ